MNRRLTELAHEAVRAVLGPGEVAVDATAGNGHDTAFLARLVGPSGRVFAFDIQPEALTRTAARIGNAGAVTLLARDHAEMAAAIPREFHGQVGAVMFNLGYRPGGPPEVVTRRETTCRAISAGLQLLRPGGVLTVIAYTGHPGGKAEAVAVADLLWALPDPPFHVTEERPRCRTLAPWLFVVHRRVQAV